MAERICYETMSAPPLCASDVKLLFMLVHSYGILGYPAPVMLNMVVGFYGDDKFVGAGYISIP